ncbi:hypothetical protein WJX75_005330 [Coccomyxa subellipsoidea]|uniref:Uncharacterized protein n=1 Tax=Coccomyxa subellipsoidea TaxID=248742 RepID=A0ABR2YY92_9CHLO
MGDEEGLTGEEEQPAVETLKSGTPQAQGRYSPARVREATRALQDDRRAQLREVGRRKFEEFRARRQSKASLPPTPTSDGKPSLAQLVFKDQSPAPGVAAVTDAQPESGPLVDMLLQQVSELMQEKRSLTRANEQLQRENQQLQELVGYLSYESNNEPDQP